MSKKRKLSEVLVEKRYLILGIMLTLTVIGVIMMNFVNINTDMTSYLPEQSEMKQGLDQMKEDFPELSLTSSGTVRVMTTGLEEKKISELVAILRQMPEIAMVKYQADSEAYHNEDHALIELTVLYDTDSPEMKSLKAQLEDLSQEYSLIYQTGEDAVGNVPVSILLIAVVLLFAILFLMCRSWAEPFLFLITIGCAIAINNGTNALLPSVSNITYSIAAILQLVLSMDYSIILINRYRDERKETDDRKEAMKAAITGAFPSIAGSSMTTVVGLLSLVFMSFSIGADIGIVLAKGVLISMICIITMLPALILHFDNLIEKTAKKVIPLPTGMLSRWAFRTRKTMGIVLIVLFVVTFFFKDKAGISYTLLEPSEIDTVFGQDNAIVLLYANEDEEKIPDLLKEFSSDPQIKAVNCYATTLGKAMTSDELIDYIAQMGYAEEIEPYQSLLPLLFAGSGKDGGEVRMTIEELFDSVQDMIASPLLGNMITDDAKEMIMSAADMLESGKKQLVGSTHSILMFSTSYPQESQQTNEFLDRLAACTDALFSQKVYQIGNSPMQYEMSKTFKGELNRISLITAATIFLVVLFTFHTLSVPVILIVLIQTAVYLTMLFMSWIGAGIYYLALLIVQSILMGATIDYGILYASLYQEAREHLPLKEAIDESYRKSIHTIMTSGMIIVFVTWIVGYAFANPAITQICHIITVGSIMALLLILLVLPGAVASLTDRRYHENNE